MSATPRYEALPEGAACPAGLDTDALRQRVRQTYERVAAHPAGDYHFNVGAAFAVAMGYDAHEIDALPARAIDRFAGVGCPFVAGPIPEGAVVLDHACGAGTDLLIAARQVGPTGLAIGVDLTPGMCEQAHRAAGEAGFAERVDIRPGRFEALPVPDGTVDVVISNGVVNLAPDKAAVFLEIVRVLKPGGVLLASDVLVGRALAEATRRDADLWAACIGGALTEEAWIGTAIACGLRGVERVARHESFRGTAVERKFGRALPVTGATFRAFKPKEARLPSPSSHPSRGASSC